MSAYHLCIYPKYVHCKQTKDGVKLFLPFFGVETVGNALIERVTEWSLQHSKDQQLRKNFKIKNSGPFIRYSILYIYMFYPMSIRDI